MFKKKPKPFVKLSVERFADETEVAKPASTSPVWTKTFRLSVVDCVPSDPSQIPIRLSDAGKNTVYPTSELSLEVFYRIPVLPDRLLCETKITIGDLLKQVSAGTGEHASVSFLLRSLNRMIKISPWNYAQSRDRPMLLQKVISPSVSCLTPLLPRLAWTLKTCIASLTVLKSLRLLIVFSKQVMLLSP